MMGNSGMRQELANLGGGAHAEGALDRGAPVGLVGHRPGDRGFAGFLMRRGIAAEIRVDTAERLGPASFAPVRW